VSSITPLAMLSQSSTNSTSGSRCTPRASSIVAGFRSFSSANEYRRSACHACERQRPTVHEKRYVTAMYRVYLHPRALTPRSRTQGTAPQSSLCPDGCLPLLLSTKNSRGRDGDVVVATGRGLGAKEAREGRASARKRGVGRSFATRGLRKCISCDDHLFHSLYSGHARGHAFLLLLLLLLLLRPRSDPRSDGSRAAGGRRGVAPGVRRTTGPSSSLEAHASATSAAAEAASASAE
jgi:hypothetical protein